MGREFEPGCRFGPLVFEREIGRGAFAEVWLARHAVLDRPVAVKVLRGSGAAGADAPTAESAGARFLTEARLVARLKSPHIVTLYGVHALTSAEGWGEGYLLEMEYVEEGTLQDALDRGVRLPADRVRAILRGVASALSVAHAHGVVHGDVKPANVLLGRRGDVKLSDFGLARLAGDASRSWNQRGEVAGTPSYMAPEVVQGEHPTVASDLWSVGVVLYRLLAGRLPFDGRTADALFAQIHNATPPNLPQDAPSDLASVAVHCLAKQPGDRPPSAEALLESLRGTVREEPSHAVGPASVQPVPPLIGREAETDRITALLDAARQGAGAALVVSADAGLGKSALLRHTAESARRRGFHVVEAAVTPVRGLVRPLLGALAEFVGDPGDRGDAIATPAARRSVVLSFGELGRQSSAVRRALEESQVSRPPDPHEAAWAAEQILAALVRRRPVAVLLDDAHHADRQDAGLLADVAAHFREAPFLLVVATRPRIDDGVPEPGAAASGLSEALAHAGAARIDLGPLAPDVLYSVLRASARGLRIAPDVSSRILDVAEGNPLLAIELLRHLVQSGAVVESEGGLAAGPAFAAADLPRRFHELVALRLERLPDEDRALLDVAAVDGLAFDGEALAAALERPLIVLLRRLQALARRGGLIVPQAAGYRFAHPVVQEVVYRDLAPDLRRATHRRLAEHLDGRDVPADAERLGTHWERGGEPARAAPYLLRAALDATRRQAYLRAIDLATRGGLLPDGISPRTASEHADLLFALCGCLSDLGQPVRAEAILTRVLAAADAADDPILRERTVVWREDVRYHASGADAVDAAELERACTLLPRSEELGRAFYLLGTVAKVQDRLDEAARRLLLAQQVFSDVGQPRLVATTTNQLASVALRSGRLAQAEAAYAEAAAASTTAGRRTNAAISTVNGILAALARGTVEGLEDPLHRAIRTLESAGAANHAALSTVVLAQVRIAAGDVAGAQRAATEALEVVERANYQPGIANARLELARLADMRGDLDAARADLAAARDAARSAGDRDVNLDILALDVRCATHAADRRAALEGARAAAAAARGGAGGAAVAKLVLSLAESVIHGLPVAALTEVSDLVASIVPGEDPTATIAPVAVAAALELRGPGTSSNDAMRRAATAIRARPCGERRAELLALAGWLDAEAAARSGDRTETASRAESASRDANVLGHVWIEAALLSLLARTSPEGPAASRLGALLDRVGRGIKWESDRRRVLQAWGRS